MRSVSSSSSVSLSALLLLLLCFVVGAKYHREPQPGYDPQLFTTPDGYVVTQDEEVVCGDEQLTLIISAYTDQWAPEDNNTWTLEHLQDDEETWEIIESQDMPLVYTFYNTTVCLEKDELYRWNMTDTFGDGFCECTYYANEDGCEFEDRLYCGQYKLELEGIKIFANWLGAFEYGVSTLIDTLICQDEAPECGQIQNQIDEFGVDAGVAICETRNRGNNIYDVCKEVCGTVLSGPCTGRVRPQV